MKLNAIGKIGSRVGIIGLLLVIGLTVIGCGGGNSPSGVVKQLYSAIEKGDAKKIGELMTPEAASMMVMFLEKAKGQAAASGGIKSTKETINGDKATVNVTFANGETSDWDLVKIDGKWKVDMDMSK